MNRIKFSKLSITAIFSLICLSACEPNKSNSTQLHPTSPSVTPEQSSSYQADVLVRGVYDPFILQPAEIRQPEQSALLRDLFEGLVIYDPQGNIVTGMAESWESADQKTWIFHLRQNAKWSNGEDVTAQDFVRSWQNLALSDNPQKEFLLYMNMQNAKQVIEQSMPVQQLGVQVLDEHSLQIQLDKSTPYLPKMLVHIALLPSYQATLEQKKAFITNGAYRVVEQTADRIQLSQNPYYSNNHRRAFSKVIYQKIDVQQPSQPIDIIQNVKHKSDNINYFPQLCTYFYEFNFRYPILKQKAVRSALISMIPSNIVSQYPFIMPNGNNYLPNNMQFEQQRDFEPTLVEQKLQQAGITEQNPLKLRLTYDNHGLHQQIAEHLIRGWSQSDLIRVQAEPVSYQTLLEKRVKGDFQIIRSGWCADYNDPSAFLSMLHSQSADNKMGFSDPEIDQLLAQTLSPDISAKKRTALYQQIIERTQQEYVMMPIFQYATPVSIVPNVAGYNVTNPTGVIYSKDLYRLNLPKSTDTK
ncbi:peptide ABC transporter substrate-binding protein [Lonepinella sp. BR2882]|uniref:peptide ABC transporter substrate-binding protein n=1 Tax=Lonepinella sp. BR2882 TaxID=3095283 RepID=UPI003F6E2F72